MSKHTCVVLHACGSYERIDLCHKTLHEHFGGPLTIVGAIDDANVVALGRRDAETLECNVTCARCRDCFEDDVRGDVVLVGSDAHGRACHVDVSVVQHLLCLGESEL